MEIELGKKIDEQHKIEQQIKDAEFSLSYKKYEIDNLRDEMIAEYQDQIEDRDVQIEGLRNKENKEK